LQLVRRTPLNLSWYRLIDPFYLGASCAGSLPRVSASRDGLQRESSSGKEWTR
jgi:hypothetical protein